MGKIIRNILGIIFVILLNGFGFAGRTAAMPMHDMDSMSHTQSSAANCATLCRTAVVESQEQSLKDIQEENDDEPYVPFYLQLQDSRLDATQIISKHCIDSIKPPPKVPIHILHCVSRS